MTVVMAPDSRTEARSVAETIRKLHLSGRAFRDIAVLSHSVRMLPREFEDELRRQGIPYVTSGGSGFFDRQEIKDVLALLRLAENPMDDGALVRILQGLSTATAAPATRWSCPSSGRSGGRASGTRCRCTRRRRPTDSARRAEATCSRTRGRATAAG